MSRFIPMILTLGAVTTCFIIYWHLRFGEVVIDALRFEFFNESGYDKCMTLLIWFFHIFTFATICLGVRYLFCSWFMIERLHDMAMVFVVLVSWRDRERLMHTCGFRKPVVPYAINPVVKPTESDVAICERLLTAYHKAERRGSKNDLWGAIRGMQGEYIGILEKGRPDELAGYLCNMAGNNATLGTVQGADEYRKLCRSASYRRRHALMTKDALVSLAEAVGALPIENPEQGVWGESLHYDIADLMDGIESEIGRSLNPPFIEGCLFHVLGLNLRDLHAIYTAWLLRSFGTVAEIGGGTGRCAYWANRFGARNYAIYDLPHINVLQGFYLIKAGIKVALYGEEIGSRVFVMPDYAFKDWPKADAVLNQDSMPEIARPVVMDYLREIKEVADQFVSVNHESCPSGQLNVPELVREVGGYRMTMRMPYWLRKGYVLEVYDTK